jgi:Glyoxalase-like domain
MDCMKPRLDHLVVAATTLEDGSAFIRDHLGLELQEGGRHERMGTHNRLLRLDSGEYANTYLEVIAIDPDGIRPQVPRWFGLDSFVGIPRLVHWVVRAQADDLERLRLPEHGQVHPMTRGPFSWKITIPGDGRLPGDGLIPTLIAWNAGSQHPSERLEERGCNLLKLEGTHPAAEEISSRLALLGLGELITVNAGPVSLRATLRIASEMKFLAF